jgi:hypothetical protein
MHGSPVHRSGARRQEVTLKVHHGGPVGPHGVQVESDDERMVVDARGDAGRDARAAPRVEVLTGRVVRLRAAGPAPRTRAARVMAVVYAMVLGADSIDDTGVLRAARLVGGWVPAH